MKLGKQGFLQHTPLLVRRQRWFDTVKDKKHQCVPETQIQCSLQ